MTRVLRRDLFRVIVVLAAVGGGILLADEPKGPPAPTWKIGVPMVSYWAGPSEDEPFIDWLLNAPDEYFVSRRQRANWLAYRLLPNTYRLKPCVNVAKGRKQLLVLAWLPYWRTGYQGQGTRLEDCVQVHFEFTLPIYPLCSDATCKLHCEANPYMKEKLVKRIGDDAKGFRDLMSYLSEEIHQRLQGTSWKPSNRGLQKACFRCPMTKETTIAEIRAYLAPRLDEVRDKVTAALIAAGQRCHLGWWRRVKAQSSLT